VDAEIAIIAGLVLPIANRPIEYLVLQGTGDSRSLVLQAGRID
jgi:hypothetical protein